MTFSLKKLITSLIDIIISSPSSVLFIILGLLFSAAMIINIKKNKTMGKTLYMIGWIFIISFVIIKYNNFMSNIFDNLILNVIRQIFFPNIATYTIIIIITNIIFLYTILNKKSTTSYKLINTPFFIIIMVLMVYTIELVSKNKINIYVAKEVYTNESIRTIIESTTLIFSLWTLILISKKILKILIEKSNKKILQEYQNKKTPEIPTENQLTENISNPVQLVQENQLTENIPNQVQSIQENQLTENIPNPVQLVQENQLTENIPNPVQLVQENQLTENIPNPVQLVQENQLTENIPNPVQSVQENQLTENIPNQVQLIQENQLTENITQKLENNNSSNESSDKTIKPIFVLPKKEIIKPIFVLPKKEIIKPILVLPKKEEEIETLDI